MCGIFVCFSLCPIECNVWLERLRPILERRGPDVQQRLDFELVVGNEKLYITLYR